LPNPGRRATSFSVADICCNLPLDIVFTPLPTPRIFCPLSNLNLLVPRVWTGLPFQGTLLPGLDWFPELTSQLERCRPGEERLRAILFLAKSSPTNWRSRLPRCATAFLSYRQVHQVRSALCHRALRGRGARGLVANQHHYTDPPRFLHSVPSPFHFLDKEDGETCAGIVECAKSRAAFVFLTVKCPQPRK